MTCSLFKSRPLAKVLTLLLSALLVSQNILPMAAYAQQADVALQNHTTTLAQTKTVSGLRIDDVDAPQASQELDGEARVQTAEGEAWYVPVMWFGDNMQLSTVAEEGRSYLPVLAFFVPEGLALDGDTIQVTLSDSLTALFGTQDIISVYDASTGVTYILPASLRDFFTASSKSATVDDRSVETERAANSEVAQPAAAPESKPKQEQELEPVSAPAQEQEQEPGQDPDPAPAPDPDQELEGLGAADSLVDIFCASTARNALTDDDLEWLINLILQKLQPQAVELLLNSFPAFRTAANNNEIGKEIGLYIYYQKGDNDGGRGHNVLAGALAYVSADVFKVDDTLKYGYMIGVDLDSLIQKDAQKKPVTNPTTGKYILLRDGNAMRTFENTIVHETFHAMMDDYNRTGMAGGTNMQEVYTPNDKFASPELATKYVTIRYPKWFIEGTASAVENVYQFRYWLFQVLRRGQTSKGSGTGDLAPSYTNDLVFENYINAKYNDGTFVYFELPYSNMSTDEAGRPVDNDASRYVTGYLATLYLSGLAAERYLNQGVGRYVDGVANFDAAAMRSGLNAILERMHNGATLDSIITEISPTRDGEPIYKSTSNFSDVFVRGPQVGNRFMGDNNSIKFVTDFLNYLLYVDNKLPKDIAANGSMLFDFAKEFLSPLDPNKEAMSDYLKIINSNEMTPSTVKNDTIAIGGGTTTVNTVQATSTSNETAQTGNQTSTDALPMAAKTDATQDVAATDQGTNEQEDTAGAVGDAAGGDAANEANEQVESTEKSVPEQNVPEQSVPVEQEEGLDQPANAEQGTTNEQVEAGQSADQVVAADTPSAQTEPSSSTPEEGTPDNGLPAAVEQQ